MMIHQIWIGAEMPERIRAATERIRTAATAGGWHYHLWGEADLRAAFRGEAVPGLLDRARCVLPPATWAALCADWARWRILAEYGGLYLDTDNELTVDAFPMPEEFGGADITQHTRRDLRMETGAISANGAAGREAAKVVLGLMATRLLKLGDLIEVVQQRRLTDLIAPQWVLDECHPALRVLGYSVAPMRPEVASCTRREAALYHWGSWTWHKDKRAPEATDTRPAWQRPRGAVVLPGARRGSQRTEEVPEVLRAHFALPEGTRRVVLLANSVRGFCTEDAGLREGDLVVHFSRARHKERAMELAPCAVHWLICRSGGKRPRNWYTPASFDGFERVFFVDSALPLHLCAFQRAYNLANPGKSPTTGFIAAALFRALHPGVPLVLAGFDPGVSHGSPMYEGHAWQYEAAYYRRHNFNLIKPHEQK